MTSAVNRMPSSHVTKDWGEEVMQRQTEALPPSTEDCSKNAHF